MKNEITIRQFLLGSLDLKLPRHTEAQRRKTKRLEIKWREEGLDEKDSKFLDRWSENENNWYKERERIKQESWEVVHSSDADILMRSVALLKIIYCHWHRSSFVGAIDDTDLFYYAACWLQYNDHIAPASIVEYLEKFFQLDGRPSFLKRGSTYPDPDVLKRIRNQKQLNLSAEERRCVYKELYKKQRGKCGIKGCQETGKNSKLAIDHCHKTGKIRGLLCRRHNTGLGFFEDSISELQGGIAYLKKNSEIPQCLKRNITEVNPA